MMEKAYYLHMRRLFPKMRLLFTDTDSVMVQIFELQGPLHAMAEANLNGASLFDVAGKSKDPERDLSALSAAARAKAIEVMGQLGKLGDETFPARILEYVGLRSKMYSRAQGGLCAAAQPRARDSRGDRREEVALPLQRQGLRPRRSQLAAAGATWSSCGCWALTLRQALRPSTS